MLPAIVGEAIGGFALASTIVALAGLLARARSQRADAERTIAFERELASDLLEQADALDRLVVAVAGLADDLDEQRVLDRIASATRQLLHADAALVVELSEDGLLVCAAHDSEHDELVPPPLTFSGDASATLRGAIPGHVDSVRMSAPGLGATDLVLDANADAARTIRKLTRGGVEFAIEATGVPEVLRVAMDSLAQRGTCGLVGAAASRATSALDISTLLFGRKLVGIVEGDSVPSIFIPRLLDLHAQGHLPIEKIVTLHPFDEINDAIRRAESGELVKPVVVMA